MYINIRLQNYNSRGKNVRPRGSSYCGKERAFTAGVEKHEVAQVIERAGYEQQGKEWIQ